MHTIIHRNENDRFPSLSPSRARAEMSESDFRSPHYECIDLPQSLRLAIYVPGVDAADVDLTTEGTDLIMTARKPHHVRVNWQALHLESAQRDYRLTLRLGAGYDFDTLTASIAKGVLTIVLPKRRPANVVRSAPQRQVA
ncbi:MAG TPA: Hsp20/alpha crystallin family protein [Lacunisphaera sp.]|nr:Hsp20/alpha crystallin family protein [Lacunisphaera sp.]